MHVENMSCPTVPLGEQTQLEPSHVVHVTGQVGSMLRVLPSLDPRARVLLNDK